MSFELIDDEAGVVRFRLTGVVTRPDMECGQSAMADAIARHGTIRVLVILDDFGGWQSGVDWGDISFFQEHDAHITRIAVVGDEQWKEEALAFAMASLRSGAVEFFERGKLDAANRWLA